jgi:hypothetical protein
MDFSEFERKILKLDSKKKVKITNSWGVYDAYKYIRKHQWYDIGRPLKEGEFYAIIRKVNQRLADLIIAGETIVFPERMGKLEIRKFERGASIVNGKLKITYPVDWKKTLYLWFEDEEERKKKTLCRFDSKYTYCIRYNRWEANYENKRFYEFSVNRKLKKGLKENIEKSKIDTLW